MDDAWLGRRLMLASSALAARAFEDATAAESLVTGVASSLLREIGRCLHLGEAEAWLPFARTRGVLRVPSEGGEHDLVRAYNRLVMTAAEYLRQLPGATEGHERFVRDRLAFAARETLRMRDELMSGTTQPVSTFGGATLVAFASPDRP